jgi:hypothetical protein
MTEDVTRLRQKLDQAREAGWFDLFVDSRTRKIRRWAEDLESRMMLWLDGEDVEYIEFGFASDERGGGDDLVVVVLTELRLLHVRLHRDADVPEHARISEFTFYDRAKLADLRVQGMEHPERWPWNRTLHLIFSDPEFTVRLPLEATRETAWEERGRQLTLSLRRNLPVDWSPQA